MDHITISPADYLKPYLKDPGRADDLVITLRAMFEDLDLQARDREREADRIRYASHPELDQ